MATQRRGGRASTPPRASTTRKPTSVYEIVERAIRSGQDSLSDELKPSKWGLPKNTTHTYRRPDADPAKERGIAKWEALSNEGLDLLDAYEAQLVTPSQYTQQRRELDRKMGVLSQRWQIGNYVSPKQAAVTAVEKRLVADYEGGFITRNQMTRGLKKLVADIDDDLARSHAKTNPRRSSSRPRRKPYTRS